MGPDHPVEAIEKAIRDTSDAGLHPLIFILFGTENRDPERARELHDFLQDLPGTFHAVGRDDALGPARSPAARTERPGCGKATHQCVRILTGHSGPVGAVCTTGDGRYVLTAGLRDGSVRQWELDTGRWVSVSETYQTGQLDAMDLNPEGHLMTAVGPFGGVSLERGAQQWEQGRRSLHWTHNILRSMKISKE